MARITIDAPAYITAEIERRSEGIGKRRAILEALCAAWDLSTAGIPTDQRRKGSDTYEERREYGWHNE